jgi:hypothetical protein
VKAALLIAALTASASAQPVAPTSAAPVSRRAPPKICTSIYFDLRSMPVSAKGHVDSADVRSRRDWLAMRVRKTAGAPAIEIWYPLTESTFDACFTASATQTALERCQAVVAEVAVKPGTRGRAMFRGPQASACRPDYRPESSTR